MREKERGGEKKEKKERGEEIEGLRRRGRGREGERDSESAYERVCTRINH